MQLHHFLFVTALSFASFAYADDSKRSTEPVHVAQAAPAMGTPAPVPAPQAGAPASVHGTLRGVLAAADKGPAALRQYVQRTRMIYGYRFEDFARPEWDR